MTSWHGVVSAGPTTGLVSLAKHTSLGWTLKALVLGSAVTGHPRGLDLEAGCGCGAELRSLQHLFLNCPLL